MRKETQIRLLNLVNEFITEIHKDFKTTDLYDDHIFYYNDSFDAIRTIMEQLKE